jgi:hypothetical protein
MSSLFTLKNMLLNSTKTGNYIIDYFINIIILSSITYFFQNLKLNTNNIINIIKSLFKSEYYVEIVIDTKSMLFDRGGIKMNRLYYSKNFQALTYYIKELNSNDIHCKREPEKNEKDNNPIFSDMFIPDQYEEFVLDVNKSIKCVMVLKENSQITKENDIKIDKNHSIKVFSNNKNTSIKDLELFIDECSEKYSKYIELNSIKEQYYFCYKYSEDNGSSLYYSEKIFNTNRTFDTIFFENKDNYIRSLKFFIENEGWYKKKGIPYHFGVLLHGTPGCGKTSIIKATLQYTKRNAVIIPLNRVKTCGEFESIFYENQINNKNIPNEKRVYIFEDFDCLSDIIKQRDKHDEHNKKEITEKVKSELEILSKLTEFHCNKMSNPDDELNLSFLLNIFDGILENPGRIIILTSNYPDKIDKALLRPGRIDVNIELKKASILIIEEILASFYDKDIEYIRVLCTNKFKDYELTPAEIMNICQKNIFDINNCINELSLFSN